MLFTALYASVKVLHLQAMMAEIMRNGSTKL
jgi:hypothetical protein